MNVFPVWMTITTINNLVEKIMITLKYASSSSSSYMMKTLVLFLINCNQPSHMSLPLKKFCIGNLKNILIDEHSICVYLIDKLYVSTGGPIFFKTPWTWSTKSYTIPLSTFYSNYQCTKFTRVVFLLSLSGNVRLLHEEIFIW